MRIAIALLVSLITLHAQIPQPTDFDGWKNRGFGLLVARQFQEAAGAYERATTLKPNDPGARLYLGLAYMLMSIGAPTPGNAANAGRARAEFKRVLELDAESPMALAALAAMSYQESKALQGSEKWSKLHEARDWNKRVIVADPANKQAHLALGVIAWTEFHPAWMEALATNGWKPGDAGPWRNAASRAKLLSQYGPLIEDGIANFRAAIEIDPQYVDALLYASMLVRERADLRDTLDQYNRDNAEANEWTRRAGDVRRERLQRPQSAAVGPAAWYESLALVMALPPPPPVLPPPPPPLPPKTPPTIGRIEITGVAPGIADMLRNRLRVRVGDLASPEIIAHVAAEIHQIDEHSRVSVTIAADGPPFGAGAALRIAISSFAFPLGPDSVTYDPLPDPAGKRITLSGEVAAANLVTRVNPTYPPLAKAARVQGVVQLMATVGTDGRILNLQVLSGDPLLVPAALAAVKRWVYKPTLRDGKPVEVNTPVAISFTLSGQ